MAFVFQRPGSKCWYAGYVGTGGNQVKVSLKLRADLISKKKALASAQKLEDAAHLASTGRLTQVRGQRIISEMVEHATGSPLVVSSVKNWLNDWAEGKKATKRKATYLSYKQAVEEFMEHLGPDRSARGVELVNVRDFQTFRDKQVQQGKTAQTANNLLKRLRIAFNLARKQGVIPTNPADAVESLPTENVARSTFTLDHLKALVATAQDDWRGVILAGIYTGQRLRDITNLRWEAVNLPERSVAFVQIKTKRRVLMPIHAALATWLATRPAPPNGKAFVFPSLANRSTGGAHGLSGRFKDIMGKSGIHSQRARERSTVKNTKGRALYALSFHCLRHTFNSIMANAGIAQEVRQELTGHSSSEMNRVYTHHELSSLRAAVDILPLITAGETSA